MISIFMVKKKETKSNEYKLVAIDALIPYDNNPRLNSGAVDYLANSIRELGFGAPILVDKDMVIIAGHTRLLASRKLGLKEVPVVILNNITPEQARAMRLADNKVPESSTWDLDALDIELGALKDVFDMEDFGFLDMKYDTFNDDEGEEGEDIPVERPPMDDVFNVLVECRDESERTRVVEMLANEGIACRKV